MFWINPYSQRNQRWRWIRPLEEAKAQEAADEQAALEREILDLRREWHELKREIAARQQERKYEGQPRDHGRYSFGKMPKLGSEPAAMRRGGPRTPATPAQQARLAIASARAREAVSRVQQLDPNWRPAPSFTSPDTTEGMIGAKEAEAREAEARFIALSRADQDAPYPLRNPPTTAEVLAPGGSVVGSRVPGVDTKVRTVMPETFERIRTELMGGARPVEPDAKYDGVWYKREDGSIVGFRLSGDHGLTLDVIESIHPPILNGFRIHQR